MADTMMNAPGYRLSVMPPTDPSEDRYNLWLHDNSRRDFNVALVAGTPDELDAMLHDALTQLHSI